MSHGWMLQTSRGWAYVLTCLVHWAYCIPGVEQLCDTSPTILEVRAGGRTIWRRSRRVSLRRFCQLGLCCDELESS